jgi:hypothetical protein
MDSEAFNNEFLSPSPRPDLSLSLAPAATATQLTNEPLSDDGLDENSGDDDGLYGDTSLGEFEGEISESGFGEGEEVVVASEQYSWKIDHAKGDHKFKRVLVCIHAQNSD